MSDLEKKAADAEAAAASAGEALAKVMAERDNLVTRINAKGALRAVDKAADSAESLEKKDEPKDTLSLIKAAQSRPLQML